MNKGTVFNIQRFSVHDGPGIRTTIFLKGCPLNCIWCSNPESQEPFPRILYDSRKCINCNSCVNNCPKDETIRVEGDMKLIDAKKCTLCKKCLEVCYAGALELIGKEMSTEEIMLEVLKDVSFYKESGGGITLSGGEPTLQYKFASSILDACLNEGIDTALETCGYSQWTNLKVLIQRANLILYDIKHMDSGKHKLFTGCSNHLILENAKKIAMLAKKMVIRVPIIPTFNDSEGDFISIIKFVKSLFSVGEIHLLPYHRLGKNKYKLLDRRYVLENLPSPDQEKMEKLKALAEESGLVTQIGG